MGDNSYCEELFNDFPASSVVKKKKKKSTCQHRRHRFNPWVGKIPQRRKWQPTPVFLSGKSHGQRSLQCFQTVVLEKTFESPLDFKEIKQVQDPMDCSPPGPSVHGISQARIPEWVAISFSGESSRPRDQTCVSCIGNCILYHQATWEAWEPLNVEINLALARTVF